jgi:hypothetical protein
MERHHWLGSSACPTVAISGSGSSRISDDTASRSAARDFKKSFYTIYPNAIPSNLEDAELLENPSLKGLQALQCITFTSKAGLGAVFQLDASIQ